MGIEDRIKRFLCDNLLFVDDYAYPDDASFLREGIIDSLGVMELVTFVQEELGVTVDARDVIPRNFDSVKALAAFVQRSTGP